MLAEIGTILLFLAGVACFAGVGLATVGAFIHKREYLTGARNALFMTLPLLTTVSILLIYAQYNGHYEIAYVNSVSKNAQPNLLKITALWGGQAGSLLFWSLLMSTFMVGSLWLNWKNEYRLMPWAMVITGGTLAFFLILNNFYENPFQRTWAMPDNSIQQALFQPDGAELAYPYQSSQGQFFHTVKNDFFPGAPDAQYDGRGLNPLLRHWGMIIHPPLLYLGFTGFVIPFAFAMAALITGELGVTWIRATRRWSLVAWMFLTLGLMLGGRWAYDVLGWGGYWGWDPVENSSFLPWLTGTAFLHSVQIQEKRGMLKGWNMVMILLTYLLVLFGTIATRAGLVSSVHSFAQSPLAPPMGAFLTLSIVASIGLFIWRGAQGAFDSEHRLESMLSRETMFVINNIIFLLLTFFVFWGTWAELITGLMKDAGIISNTINLGPEYYQKVAPPLFVAMFILMGIAPLAAWRKASAEKIGRAAYLPTGLTGALLIILILIGMNIWAALGFSVVAFAGFATLIEFYKGAEARHRAHGEAWPIALFKLFGRNRRRYGGYVIHISVVIIGIGIIASTIFQVVRQETLAPGDMMDIENYTMRYDQAFTVDAVDGRGMVVANVTLFENGKEVAQLRPRRDFFGADSSPMTIAGQHSTIKGDFYVLLTFWEDDVVTFRTYWNPLINFI